MSEVHPAILSGGSGSRLWPLSRELYPKQLLPLTGKLSLLQETARRVGDPARFAAPLVVCNQEHRFAIAEQLRAVGAGPSAILLEPEGRNTAAAVAVAALKIAELHGAEALVLVLPSDHLVRDLAAFLSATDIAVAAAAAGMLVTFGIAPDKPETGYGYIKRGAGVAGVAGAYRVSRFVEKPDAATAAAYLAAGDHSWNSGMFLFRCDQVLDAFARLAPEILAACRQALAEGTSDLDFVRLAAAPFGRAPALSFDVAIMEKTDRAAVVPVEMGWTDVGSWSSLAELGPHDADANVLVGNVVAEASHGSYVRSEGRLTAVYGLRDTIVVTTDDAVMVAPKSGAQAIKQLVDRLKAEGRGEATSHNRLHRPWGWHQVIDVGDRFKVKHIMVKPGESLSLQKHYHRAEHWVVVVGTAEVTRGDDVVLLHENESIYIPLGHQHRLHN
ncbi:MAG TPA: mannose-1-phosphate guanylyltransferase/mannose-6-phosphate isomerase, partial [Candidatus Sulfotelmatobacter sp.]|nr:mannose-1-phosphate guanylyltransferase/mannose-6-phosphate isomerase [Candidatus Sulfotelmatobacter sp.]